MYCFIVLTELLIKVIVRRFLIFLWFFKGHVDGASLLDLVVVVVAVVVVVVVVHAVYINLFYRFAQV